MSPPRGLLHFFGGVGASFSGSFRKARSPSLVFAALLLRAPEAFAGDGAYGRLDGDLDVSLAAGVGYASEAPIFAARASALYAVTAGAYFGYTEAFGQADAAVHRSLAAGISMRPLFWARFANAVERGPARLDLFADSFCFELGAFWAAPRGRSFVTDPGLELAAGIGLPFLEEATGPWIELRAAIRYRPIDMAGTSGADIGETGAFVSLSFAWHHILSAHIADAGDRLVR